MPLNRRKRGRPPKSEVIVKKERGTQFYACKICSNCFYTKSLLKLHEKKCNKAKTLKYNSDAVTILQPNYSCGHCKKEFKFKSNYKKHVENVHAKYNSEAVTIMKPKYSCGHCKKEFRFKSNYKKHVENVHAKYNSDAVPIMKPKYNCEHCKKVFRFKSTYRKHIENDHAKYNSDPEVTIIKPKYSCGNCKKEFRFKSSYKKHVENDHAKYNSVSDAVTVIKPKYSCVHCKKEFRFKTSYKKHVEKDHAKNNSDAGTIIKSSQYSCRHCKKKFRFKSSFKNHVENDHAKGPGSVPCDQCDVRCPNKAILDLHKTKVHERTIYECEHCGKKFVRRSHVVRHMSQLGCDGKETVKIPCEICNAQFTRRDNLMVHLRTQHIIKNEFQCKHCEYHTRSFSKLVIHFLRLHSENPGCYICDHCGQVTKSRTSMAKHLEIHGEKKFECSVCGYSTYTVEVMRRHILTHVADKPHKCGECGNSYIQRLQLQQHMKTHHENMCPTCGKGFVSKAKLIIHSREHLGLNELVCPVEDCPLMRKEFVSKMALQIHITSTHLNERAYRCQVCPKQFSNEMNMRRHMSTHTLERPRRCMYCVAARAYVRGEQLVRHVRKAHPDVFRSHLDHVRSVLGSNLGPGRVKKSELESILNVLDAESDRILEGYGSGVLYGGIQEERHDNVTEEIVLKTEESPLMNEEELANNLSQLLEQLIAKETLECFGWPKESVDYVLERVIEGCGASAADRGKWTRVQRLRENAKHLFLYVVEDKAVARMLHTHTIDQIVKHILAQGSDEV